MDRARARGIGLERVVEWMCTGPARVAGLSGRKGVIAPGADADLALFLPDDEFVVDAARLRHRHAVTPYQGRRLAGVVEQRTFGEWKSIAGAIGQAAGRPTAGAGRE